MVDTNVSAGRGSLCDPDSPDAPIEFNDSPSETNENLTPTVRNFAAGKFSRLTLAIKAHDESDTAAWKRFKNDATLAVKFVGLPDTPTEVGLVSGSSFVCASNSTVPNVVSDPTPLIQGKPRTKAGGSTGASLRIRWRAEKYDGSAWSLVTDLDSPTSGYVGNLVRQSRSLPALQENVLYRLRALTLSYYEDGSNRLNSVYTNPCYFKVDSTAPKAPQVTFGAPYSACTANDCAAKGSPGLPGAFVFKAAAGDNVSAYQYKLSPDTAWSPDRAAASTSFSVTPRQPGRHTLYVRAKDSVGTGRYGAETAVDFLVAEAQAVGQWHFGETDGPAVDSATADGPDDATLNAGAARDERGRRGLLTRDATGSPLATPVTDRGLTLNGTTGYAASAGTVLDTSASYTVSAWVRADPGVTHTMTVLTQTPDSGSPFAKKYIPFGLSYAGGGDNKWSMSVLATDGAVRKAVAQRATPRGVWAHVAGVHDAVTHKISLYLNGVLQSTVDSGTVWKATGPLQIGRGIWADAYTDYLQGSVDEVTAWQGALPAEAVADDARLKTSESFAGVELVADWSAERGSGSSVPDTTSGYGKSLSLVGAAALDGESLVLDGIDSAATAPGPVLDDTGAFTVTTLVALDGTKLAAKEIGFTGQVLGQQAADGSAWGLWYQLTEKKTVWDEELMEEKTVPVGLWRFGRLSADGKTFSAVASDESADLDSTVRLTGIFDAPSSTISLYVGGVPNGAAQELTAKAGSGDFAVGKGFAGGQFIPGRIAEVRLWAGAMAGWEQVEETVGD